MKETYFTFTLYELKKQKFQVNKYLKKKITQVDYANNENGRRAKPSAIKKKMYQLIYFHKFCILLGRIFHIRKLTNPKINKLRIIIMCEHNFTGGLLIH